MDNATANMSSNSTEYDWQEDPLERLFLELFTVVAFLSIAANLLIVFVIFKFKKLRREVTNIIILHLSSIEIVFLLLSPITLRVTMNVAFEFHVRNAIICIFFENEFVSTVAVCLFLILLVSDWYLKTYNKTRYVKFCRIYKFFVAVVYITVIVISVVASQICFVGLPLVTSILTMFLCYAVFLIFLIVMNVVHVVRRRRLRENKNNTGLILANIFYVLWIPAIILELLSGFSIFTSMELTVVAYCLGFSSPIFNFLYLFYYIDVFHVFFKRIFSWQCSDYGDDFLEEQIVSYSDVRGLKIEKD